MATLRKIVRQRPSKTRALTEPERQVLVEVAAQATLAGVAPTLRQFLAFTVEERACWIFGRARALAATLPAVAPEPRDDVLGPALEEAARKASEAPA